MNTLSKMTWRFALIVLIAGCSKGSDPQPPPPPAEGPFNVQAVGIQGHTGPLYDVSRTPRLTLRLTAPVDRTTAANIRLTNPAGTAVPYSLGYEAGDSMVLVQPSALQAITKYTLTVPTTLASKGGKLLRSSSTLTFVTELDSSDKFARISDDALLTLVQQQTFKYFWDFAHPVSGLARERNTSGDVVTSGGSGFGIMAIVTGIHRQFISRAEGLARMQKIVDFLKNKAEDFHGAFPHWLNGSSGAAVPFSQKDNGADLVETSFLMQGLLTARQYFGGSDPAEVALRADINTLWNAVEWDWFRRSNEQVLYWHWSPNYGWEMNHPVRGWNECLITYVLAASSPTHSIPRSVYENGWARNGGIRNGQSYYGITLPLGPAYGGPLFFAHYSFLGLNPEGLTDTYANYWEQNKAHTLIHYQHSRVNPRGHYGYSERNWGLTASDDHLQGYMAHEPANDNGVISPTAALSSFPYTPAESMAALHFFYYTLGDKIWKEYGFVDAFSLKDTWFADSFLAIDQGPIILMIENHRSGLLWDLFMSAPEVKEGLKTLGFSSPHL